MTDRDLMKWALYALEGSNAYDWPVVEELKERLAQPEQEPVECMCGICKLNQRQWQGLTEAEKVNVAINCGCADVAWIDFADAIEAKLRERNA